MAKNHNIFNPAIFISFATLLSRIFGFIRDILIAKYLGASLLSDLFFASFRLPNLFRRIFAEGSINFAFIPIFIKKDKDLTFANNILSALISLILIFILLFQIFIDKILILLYPGFASKPEIYQILINLSRITIFYLLFISITSFLSSILNSYNKFILPSLSPIILNIFLIIALNYFNGYENILYILSYFIFFAGIAQMLYLYIILLFTNIKINPFIISKFDNNFKFFLKKLLPAVLSGNLMQINSIIDSFIASFFISAISYIYYADRVNQLPIAIIGITLSTILLPKISSYIKNKEYDQANKMQNISLIAGLSLSLSASLSLFILADIIVEILFYRGEFTSLDAMLVSNILKIFSLGLVAYILIKIIQIPFFARLKTSIMLKYSIMSLILNIIFNLFFIFICDVKYLSIPISSVLASYINFILLFLVAIKKKYLIIEKKTYKMIFFIIISNILLSYILILLKNNLHYFSQIYNLFFIIATYLLCYMIISTILFYYYKWQKS